MKIFRQFVLPTALIALTCLPVWAQTPLPSPAREADPNAAAALTRLRMVLDTMSAGNPLAARALASDGVQKFGDYPELSFVLAYLLQSENRNAEASAALEHSTSPLAQEYSALLRGAAAGNTPAVASPVMSQTVAATAGAPRPATATRLPQSDARLAAFETTMVKLVNEERRKLGLAPLTTDSQLADIARAHSAEMRDKDYFAHDSPTEALREPMDRYRAVVQDTPRVIAENIYRVYSYGSSQSRRTLSEEDVRAGHLALMKSPGHRANIVEPRVTRIGIGIVTNAKGDMWITQMFVKP